MKKTRPGDVPAGSFLNAIVYLGFLLFILMPVVLPP